MKKRHSTKKKRPADLKFWLIHSGHWISAFVFILVTLTTVYVFFAGDTAFASTFFPPRY